MFDKIQSFFLDKFIGKLIARAAITAASFVAGSKVQGLAGAAGISISVDPSKLAEGAVVAGHAIFEWYKHWRASKAAPAA